MSSNSVVSAVAASLQPYLTQPIYIALSGGIDSIVLLHSLVQLQKSYSFTLEGIHVNHQLSPHAAEWAQFCQYTCQQWQIPCHTALVTVDSDPSTSLEHSAREARYQAIQAHVPEKAIVLTAHHADDQAETVLHHLCQGHGLAGLRGMKAIREHQQFKLLRPLLTVSQEEILAYAKAHALSWVEDESNQNTTFRRNFLRHEVIPTLKQAYPALTQTILRSQQWLAETEQQLHFFVERAFQDCRLQQLTELQIEQLQAYPTSIQPLIVRYWLNQNQIRYPSAAVMSKLMNDLLQALPDREPVVEWDQICVRRYRNRLYLQPREAVDSNPMEPIKWKLSSALALPGTLGVLSCSVESELSVDIRFNQTGVRIKPRKDSMTRTLKHLFQSKGIPPWQRKRWPMLYDSEQKLIGMPGLVWSEHVDSAVFSDETIIWSKNIHFV